MHDQLTIFNKVILQIKKTHISATDIASELKCFKENLRERVHTKFVPQEAKQVLTKLEKENATICQTFMMAVVKFYTKNISYIELWEVLETLKISLGSV